MYFTKLKERLNLVKVNVSRDITAMKSMTKFVPD